MRLMNISVGLIIGCRPLLSMKESVTEKEHVLRLNGAELRLVKIPSGTFSMGSPPSEVGSRENERPVHDVCVSSFYLGVYPVSQLQWRAVMGDLPVIAPEFCDDRLPVVNVWLEHAHEFCQRLSQLTGITVRLPSEAEWEYACRAGTNTAYSWGDTILPNQVNFRDVSRGVSGGPSAPASIGGPNAFGVCDMHGNVWEWCSDTWHDSYKGAPTDGSPWTSGGDAGYYVQRGGSWTDPAIVCRSAFRVGDIAHNTDNIVGIRVCANVG